MGKKEKDCGYWVAVLLTGAALGGIAGFVLGWSWDKRSDAISDVRVLDVMVAVGTVGAVVLSLFLILRERARAIKAKIKMAAQKIGESKPFFDEIQEFNTLSWFGVRGSSEEVLLLSHRDTLEAMLDPDNDIYDAKFNFYVRKAVLQIDLIVEYYRADLCSKEQCVNYRNLIQSSQKIIIQARLDLGYWWDKPFSFKE